MGIIPAYAGSTAAPCGTAGRSTDHPRIRGEHAPLIRLVEYVRGSSPHTRGALGSTPTLTHEHGIIPAYAGSTRPYHVYISRIRDHPRIRGEHDGNGWWVLIILGSSPHTRGALLLDLN